MSGKSTKVWAVLWCGDDGQYYGVVMMGSTCMHTYLHAHVHVLASTVFKLCVINFRLCNASAIVISIL